MKKTLTEAQTERLVLLIEECAEVAKAATKIMRFGFVGEGENAMVIYNNRGMLEEELGNLEAVVARMEKENDVDASATLLAMVEHDEKLRSFTFNQPDSRRKE